MKNSKAIILITSVLLLGLSGCGKIRQTTKETLLSLPASLGTIEDTITFVGNVSSAQSSELTWKTTGVIESVNVRLGDTVSEGDVLATLERDSLTSSVLTSEVPLLNAQDELEELLLSETAKAQAYKDLKDKELALQNAEKFRVSLDYPRALNEDVDYWAKQTTIYKQYYDEAKQRFDDVISYENSAEYGEWNMYRQRQEEAITALNEYAEVYNTYLYYSYHATENDKDQAEANIDIAESDYLKAEKAFRTYGEYPRPKDVQAAKAELETAQQTYDTRSIVAGINGTITSTDLREGDYVVKGTAALRLDNLDHLYFPLDISEIDIVKVKDGQKAQIIFDAASDQTYEGIVTTVADSGSEETYRVTFPTRVEMLEPDDKVKIGMTAEVNIILDQRENVLLVPTNALVTQNGTPTVTILNGEAQTVVPVTVGLMTDTVAEITGGDLREGDNVMVPSIDDNILRDMGLEDRISAETNQQGFPPLPFGMTPPEITNTNGE